MWAVRDLRRPRGRPKNLFRPARPPASGAGIGRESPPATANTSSATRAWARSCGSFAAVPTLSRSWPTPSPSATCDIRPPVRPASENSQPLLGEYSAGQVAVAHNGNLINARLLRDEYEAYGNIFKSTCDTEIIVHLLAKPTHSASPIRWAMCSSICRARFACCSCFPTGSRRRATRSAFAAVYRSDRQWVLCRRQRNLRLDTIGAKFIREVEPGEIVRLDKNGLHSRFFVPARDSRRPTASLSMCISPSRIPHLRR